MPALISFLLLALAAVLAIPAVLFCIEIVAAAVSPRHEVTPLSNNFRQRIVVLVPAHNESSIILETLEDAKGQLRSGDRLVVVADNCTDDTAAIARTVDAEVTERHDLSKVGKGYALDWGIRYLSSDPPAIVVVLDADCRLTNDALGRLAEVCAFTNRPVQARCLMTAPDDTRIDYRVAMFAFRLKNWVRPLGLRAFNLPCQLMGTGMAFPWKIISSADLATAATVEDLKLGLELTRAGRPPVYCPSVSVYSEFPVSVKGARTQRERWEQGHLETISKMIIPLVWEALVQRNFPLLALTLDAAVPPLTLLGMLLGTMVLLSGVGALCGLSSTALVISVASFLSYILAVLLGWMKFGRDILPLNCILSFASYTYAKLLLYKGILSRGSRSEWIRTDREKIDQNLD